VRIHHRLFALAALLVVGCANIEYPKEWSPPAQATTGCASIDGTYQNRPSSVIPEGASAVELRSFLDPGVIFPSRWVTPPTSTVQTVTLEYSNGILTIIERGEGKSDVTRLRVYDRHNSPEGWSWVYNWTWGATPPSDAIFCTHSAWYRTGEELPVGSLFAGASEVSGWNFQRAEDGSLAVHLHHGTLELVGGLIPTSNERWIWYRYEKAQ
jgi:hypothetical protein